MAEIVKDLRTKRHGMVQSEGQYIYAHIVIFSFIETKISGISALAKTMERMNQFNIEYKKFADKEERDDKELVAKKKWGRNETQRDK